MNSYADNAEAMDSDAFLTQIESKLRGPFTSMDFAKAVASGSTASSEYLSSVLSVLPRAEKVTQLRILIGILGLEPSELLDDEIDRIVTTTQNAPLYEEWVRVISGIVEEILFRRDSDTIVKNEACRLLDKTSSEILLRIKEFDRDVSLKEEETEHSFTQSDANPLFVPYCYHMMSPSLIKAIIPESKEHSHFKINNDSQILQVDMNMEVERLKEEQDHHVVAISSLSKSEPLPIKMEAAGSSQLLESNDRKIASARAKSSSMFMPSKPLAGRGAVGTGTVLKAQLHQRKAGAAQALLAKGRRGRMMQSVAAAGNSVTASAQAAVPRLVAGRTAVTLSSTARGPQKSKMKMIDVAEVQGLETKKLLEVSKAPATQKTHAVLGRKRPLDELTKEHGVGPKGRKTDSSKSAGIVEKPNLKKDQPSMVKKESNGSPAETGNAGELASAALLAYQSRQASIQPQSQIHSVATEPNDSSLNTRKQQDWRELLQLRSNRLSEDDRHRIQQFFVDRFNPTPEQRQYKMKLHEERTIDDMTGKPMKEAYYLELDYETFTSTQTKKVKRYHEN